MLLPVAQDPSMDHSSSDVETTHRSARHGSSSKSSKHRKHSPPEGTSKQGEDSHSHFTAPPIQVPAASPAIPHSNPVRHPDFWFHDGSIILQVQSKLFRVHQTILANHSEVFAGLFDVPQPGGPSRQEGDESMLEGCHIVVLHDDEKDFEDLLRAVYNPAHFDDHLSPTIEVDTMLTLVSGILRLSTKYLIRTLRQRCISLLTSKFPSTFDEYGQKSSPANSPRRSASGKIKQERYRSDTIMRAITLAMETNVLTILPYLYYCTARLPLRRILKNRPGDISFYHKTVALVGRERLRYAELSLSYSFLIIFRRAPECKEVLKCGYSKGPEREWRLLEAESVKGPNPLRGYTRWDELGVCRDCLEWSAKTHLDGRKEVWERLPELFELPKWELLKEAQNR